ncbi:hypothetical protein ACTNEA_07820 [Oscillospiraceae bacterium HCP3S3_F4]
MEKTVERKRIVYFDVLNVLACLCVVGMHCNGAVHAFSDSSGCCHFVFIKYACDYPIFRNEKFIRLIKWLSGASFGIYLIHVLVIDRITSWFSVDTLSGWWRLFGAFAVYFVALLLVKVLQKIPYVGKYLFP